ncbi:hypothetical protein [Bradyrhizobium prioriisuperbiae]|uniref:hypothetical protein n=1 Tax=Bradyrhizobium prioriisuperbiae TaxID=2854389 RepID=UPI0028F14736|nr:hypothetical protein [Bradyrhizobium prioritasuperba]
MPMITRRNSLAAGAALLVAPNAVGAEPARDTSDPALRWLRVSNLAMTRLLDLDLAGRSQMTFMRGHMSEIVQYTDAQAYFNRFYTSVGKEFLQFDDYSFVLHHCLRVLYVPWREEIELLRTGLLGSTLGNVGGRLPDMRERPTAPTRRPGAVKANWYSEVYEALSKGVRPVEKGARNEAIKPDKCVLSGSEGLDLIWASFLVYGCDVWARQIPLMWELVGSAISARRAVDQMPKSDLQKAIAARADEYTRESQEFTRLFLAWQDYHSGTVAVHDPMFDKIVRGLGAWLQSLTTDLDSWTIKPIMKDEMYGEVASTVLAMRGTPTSVKLPEMKYWRVLQFTPPSNKIGAPGMPPFA